MAAGPLAARAQQAAISVVGFLGAPSPGPYARYVAAVHQGLKEAGFVEGQNLRFEYRWAEGHYDRLPALAMELVDRHVAVIVPIGGAPATVAAKAATSTVPIIFNMTADPLELGLIASLNRPGGNVTGVAMMGVELEVKRLELLRELVPASALIAMLINPSNAQAETQSREVEGGSRPRTTSSGFERQHRTRDRNGFCHLGPRASRCAAGWRRYVFHEPAHLVRPSDSTPCDTRHLPMERPRRRRRLNELRGKLAR